MPKSLRIGIIDADEDIRFGRKLLIDSQEDLEVVFEEATAEGAQNRAPMALLDVLVIDHRVRGLDGIQLIAKLVLRYQQESQVIPAIILTGPYFSQELLISSISAGATDLVTLDSDSAELLAAIRTSADTDSTVDFESLLNLFKLGDSLKSYVPDITIKLSTLDDREADVLAKFQLCQSDDEISHALNIAKYRVRQSFVSILQKLSLATRAQLFLAIKKLEQNIETKLQGSVSDRG